MSVIEGVYNASNVAGSATALGEGARSSALIDSQRRLVVALAGSSGSGGITTAPQARVSRVAHLSSQTLPAAGAYTSQAAYSIPDGVVSITVWITYTRGAANGKLKFKLMMGNGTEEGPVAVVDPTSTASEPFTQQSVRGGEFVGPIPADGTAVTFAVPVRVDGGATAFRVLVAEAGVTATPGTCAIALTASYAS